MNDQAYKLSNLFLYLSLTNKDKPKYSAWCQKKHQKYNARVWSV